MAGHWSEHQERSNFFLLSIMAWIAVRMGRGCLRLLCFFIAAWFLVTATEAKAASRDFFSRVLDKKPGWLTIFRQFYTFALVSGDRLLFLAGRSDKFQVRTHGEQLIHRYAREKRGCFLLVSHIGSFDAMRVSGVESEDFPIRILIDKQHNPAAIKVVEQLNPGLAAGMIDAAQSSPELVLALDEGIKHGHMIGIMADRASATEKTRTLSFLDGQAQFPEGPWKLGVVLKVPIVLCFALYRGSNRYEIFFESITEGGGVARSKREQEITDNMRLYVDRLEYYARYAPYNWFNFYQFWNNEATINH